jgi:methyl-galactoside transport system permease protein
MKALSIPNPLKWSRQQWKDFLLNNAIYIVILTIIAVIVISEPSFISVRVFRNILTQSSVRLILAYGVAGIIILQGTDLSLGRIVGFAAVISASLLQRPDYLSRFYPDLPMLPLFVPLIIASIVTGALSGVNGWVVAKFKIHPFLATLGMMISAYGILSIYFASGAPGPQPIGGHDTRYVEAVTGTTLGVPNLILYALIVSVLIWILWNKTTFGKNLYAVGGNPEAAEVSGVNVKKTIIMVYILAGGFLAACVVGGISFSGGIGKVSGAIAGVLMFTIISYGMTFVGLDQYYQYIMKGVIIVFAVAVDTQKYLKKT